jgi:hypothetical protein
MQGGGVPPGQQSWGPNPVPVTGGIMQNAGCAITLAANISFTEGNTNVTPETVRSTTGNFTINGLSWTSALNNTTLAVGEKNTGPLSVDTFNQLNASTTEYYIGIMVNYTGDPSDEHWVGATSLVTRGDAQYYQISKTSNNDSILGTSATNNRGGQGWLVENSGDTILVPVNQVTAYRIFTKPTTANDE